MKKKKQTVSVSRTDLINVHPIDKNGKELKEYNYDLISGMFTNKKNVTRKINKNDIDILNDQKRDHKTENLKQLYLDYKKFESGTVLLCVKVSEFFFNNPVKRGYIFLDFLNEKFYRLSKSEIAFENIDFRIGHVLEKKDDVWKKIHEIKDCENIDEIKYNEILNITSRFYWFTKKAKLCQQCKNNCKQAFEIHICNLFEGR